MQGTPSPTLENLQILSNMIKHVLVYMYIYLYSNGEWRCYRLKHYRRKYSIRSSIILRCLSIPGRFAIFLGIPNRPTYHIFDTVEACVAWFCASHVFCGSPSREPLLSVYMTHCIEMSSAGPANSYSWEYFSNVHLSPMCF